jgi:hypothetical protein
MRERLTLKLWHDICSTFIMKPKKPKKDKDAIGMAKLAKRSGAYVPNSSGTGITKADKSTQKLHKSSMKKAIKSLKNRGL